MDEGKEFAVYSEKYGISGTVYEYGMSSVLHFICDSKNVKIAIPSIRAHKDALKTLEAYMELFAPDAVAGRKLQLHNWYIFKNGQTGEIHAHGNVSGSLEKEDTARVDTVEISRMEIDETTGEAILYTRDQIFHCPLAHCRFRRQSEAPELLPDFERIKAKYAPADRSSTIAPGEALLVLSNYDEHYFCDFAWHPKEGTGLGDDWIAYPHTGLVQDSFLVMANCGEIDLRYFTHYRSVEFYSAITDDGPLYLENAGDVILYAELQGMQFRLVPGERVKVTEENALKDYIWLPNGDLYSG